MWLKGGGAMKRTAIPSAIQHALVATTVLLHTIPVPAGAQVPAPLPCDQLGQILGGKGSVSGTVCRVNLPRGDLNVTLLGAKLPVGMGLTSWAAFLPNGEGSMAMGDATDLARKLRQALGHAPSALGKAPAAAPRGQAGIVAGEPCSRIEEIFGARPGSADTGPGFCKVTIPRPEGEVTIHGVRLPPRTDGSLELVCLSGDGGRAGGGDRRRYGTPGGAGESGCRGIAAERYRRGRPA
jgi:hypothetical protein